MAARKKGLGPVKRFGPRYGRTVKHKLAKVELEQKSRQKCPFCSRPKARRVSVGIWECKKCESTFAARAYTVGTRVSLVEKARQFVAEAPELKKKSVAEEE